MTGEEEILASFRDAREKLDTARQSLDDLQAKIAQLNEEYAKASEALKLPFLPTTNVEQFRQFMRQPYLLMPKRQDAWYVIVPRFIDMQLGWLEYSTPSFNVFVINRFFRWLSPLPADIEERLGVQPTAQLQVVDGLLKAPVGMEEQAWERYRPYLLKRDEYGIRIKKGYERELISALVRDGFLPFAPQPVDSADLSPMPTGFSFKPHQQEAYESLLKWGSIGVYWPGGQGKTYFGAILCRIVKGSKLIVVPNLSEVEQWQRYLAMVKATDWRIVTYQGYHKVDGEYVLVIFDECHRLPAPIWSRFATINSKYRIGLSATPYREDGREDLIIALTGYPVGMSWEHFMATRAIRKPKIVVKIVDTDREKTTYLAELLKLPLKTLIFVELIESGERIAKQFNIPFVHGETKDRLDVIEKNLVTVVSRVGDEGISIKDLERTIEVEFLGKSRRQEAQRAYRLLHSVRPDVAHIVVMTVTELDKYRTRFLALEEKGFQVEYSYQGRA